MIVVGYTKLLLFFVTNECSRLHEIVTVCSLQMNVVDYTKLLLFVRYK